MFCTGVKGEPCYNCPAGSGPPGPRGPPGAHGKTIHCIKHTNSKNPSDFHI